MADRTADHGLDRAAFIAKVSAALGRSAPYSPTEPPPVIDDRLVRVTSAGEDLAAVFAARAQASGMSVHRVQNDRVATAVVDVLSNLGARRVAVAPVLSGITQALGTRGMGLLPWPDPAGPDALYGADAGITDVEAAIAETGTLVCASGAGRSLSLIPPVHIAIVKRSQIVPDLLDYLPRVVVGPLPSNIVLITGPSKTADIEGVLITGVHGPGEVHIMLIEDA